MNNIFSLAFSLALSISLQAQTNRMAIHSADRATPVVLDQLTVNTTVFGNRACHQWTMVLKNNSSGILEANLNFPLPEKSTITAYALDIEGHLRHAVPVEKHRATQVLEAIENKNTDPGLLERTEGNNFKTRVYPVPPGGTRTVQIMYEEELTISDGQQVLRLPFSYAEPIHELQVEVRYAQCDIQPQLPKQATGWTSFRRDGNDYVATFNAKQIIADQAIHFVCKRGIGKTRVLTESWNGESYFLADVPVKPGSRNKPAPHSIALLWDISLSGLDRSFKDEFDLLSAYFRKVNTVDVQLVCFNLSMKKPLLFTVREGNWQTLKKTLEQQHYDGATQLGALDLTKLTCDEVLLFSDGHHTFHKDKLQFKKGLPIHCVNSSAKADYSKLEYIARRSGGQFINLRNTTISAALKRLSTEAYQLLGIRHGKDVQEVYPSIPARADQTLSVAGKFRGPRQQIILQFGYGKQVMKEVVVQINAEQQPPSQHDQRPQEQPLNLPRIWAQKKINELDLQYEKNKASIEATGKAFGLVTRNTSLLVLENVEDYVRYGIPPPDELHDAVQSLSIAEKEDLQERQQNLLQQAEQMNDELYGWWQQEFEMIDKPAKRKQRPANQEAGGVQALPPPRADTVLPGINPVVISSSVIEGSSEAAETPNVIEEVKNSPVLREEISRQETRNIDVKAVPLNVNVQMPAPMPSSSPYTVQSYSSTLGALQGVTNVPPPMSGFSRDGDIEDQASYSWDNGRNSATAPIREELLLQANEITYMQLIKASPAGKRYATYLKLRKDYIGIPAFYYQVGSYFLQHHQQEIGLQVLSNLAELDMENYEMMKMLGYHLKKAGLYEMEVSVFKKVLDWRPQDPQSYRDYALALEDAGRPVEAMSMLIHALTNSYDENENQIFEGIEEVLLMDMKGLLAGHPKQIPLKMVPPAAKQNMPVDIRVILNWNMLDTDMDLWVTDPDNETCMYSQRETRQGGRISNDFTDGFGPEQFLLKKARRGKYVVQANFYGQSAVKIAGETTIMAEIYTHFGTPLQKRKIVTFQLGEEDGNAQLIGSFNF